MPLAEGIVDVFSEYGLKAFGPDKRAARLEASNGRVQVVQRNLTVTITLL